MTLRGKSVRLSYGATTALTDASLSVAAGEIVALVGPSGSGKTSLLYCLSRLIKPNAGRIEFDSRDLATLDEDEAAAVRREHFGFVFQFAELVPELTLAENIGLPLDLIHVGRRRRATRVAELLERLGLSEFADRHPDQVSGGQAQRAAVARALAHEPSIIFADEPTGSLDQANGTVVLDALTELARASGTAIVLVTHDDKVAAAADRRVTVQDGVCHDEQCHR